MAAQDGAAERINTVIVGGGHCGANLALWLEEAGKGYIVLERDVMFAMWKNRRWDGFMMNTPWHHSKLHGQGEDGDVAPGSMGRPIAEDIARWEAHCKTKNIKYRERTNVVSATVGDDGLFTVRVESSDGGPSAYNADNVVACNGQYTNLRIPLALKTGLPDTVYNVAALDFKTPAELKDGAVLVVGGGQSGHQLAHLLNKARKKVYLGVSKVPGAVRNFRGTDLFFMCDKIQFNDLPTEALSAMPEPVRMGMRYGALPITGPDYSVSPHSLHRSGVTILGSIDAIDGDKVAVADNRQLCLGIGLQSYKDLIAKFQEYAAAHPEEKFPAPLYPDDIEPEWVPEPELMASPGPRELSLSKENITNVIWATGQRPDFSWICIDKVTSAFDPVNHKPDKLDTPVPGFFFSGFHWLTHIHSGNVLGFDRDHKRILEMLR